MSKYLISFPSGAMDVPDGDWERVSEESHDVIREAKAAGVYVFGGGIDGGVPPVRVAANGTITPRHIPTDGKHRRRLLHPGFAGPRICRTLGGQDRRVLPVFPGVAPVHGRPGILTPEGGPHGEQPVHFKSQAVVSSGYNRRSPSFAKGTSRFAPTGTFSHTVTFLSWGCRLTRYATGRL